jgi:hypothetical protein
MACRREWKTKGRPSRVVTMIEASARVLGPGRRQSSWPVRFLEAANSEDANQRLWAGVLQDAIEALQGTHPDSRIRHRPEPPEKLWREACAWVMSRIEEPLGTFESVCEVLGLESEVVRRDLCTMAAEHATPSAVREAWLYRNPKALARVQRGLAQSARHEMAA